MDDFLTDMDRLAALAARAAPASGLLTAGVMARIEGLDTNGWRLELPVGFLAGIGAAAVTAAAVVAAVALPVWREVLNPLSLLESLPELHQFMHL
ncbi:MAG: hypothetical protein LIP77_03610 [Planctomycetes bacterium]|nr:hypothetical protein [Planctomycetota bacterium]